jgi:N-sulfoglucosamine sulfohydrolase
MNKQAMLAVVCVVLASVVPGMAADGGRLNILFVFGDDWGRVAGAYAGLDGRATLSDVVKTPNIDRVAREGMLFKRAFVNAPSCTPCRSALLSGQYFFRTGMGSILRGAKWDASIPTFPLLLRDSGYHIGKSYKVWSPGTPEDAPFGGQKYAYEKAGRAFNQYSQNATARVKAGKSVDEAKAELLAEVRGNFDAFLAARPKDQPFLFWFGPTNTHRAWTKGSGKKLWGIDPAALTGKLPKFMPDVAEVREDFADYLGEVQALDGAIGVLLARLEELGELERTVIVLSGDHGPPGFPGGKCNLNDFGSSVPLLVRWPGGKGGRVIDDFVDMQDMAPTFLEIGGVKAPEVMTAKSLVKVLAAEGSGQIDPERTWAVNGRERHVDTAREGNLPYPHRALHTKEFLYIRNFAPERWPMGSPGLVGSGKGPSAKALENTTRAAFADMDAGPTKAWLISKREDPEWKSFYDYAFGKRPGEELYDLAKDPDETHNLAQEPEFAAVKARLSAQLLKVLTDAKDPRVINGGTAFDMAPFTDKE